MAKTRPIADTLKGYARGIAGGLLFSIAPLYTMELWWQGYTTPPLRMLLTGIGMIFVLVAYAHYAGVHSSDSIRTNFLEAFQIVAIATVISVIVLKLAGQLPSTLSFYEALTRIVGEGTIVAIGVAVGSTQLGEDPDESSNQKKSQKERTDEKKKKGSILHEMAFATLGAMLIAAGLAPTMEITMIAASAEPWAVLVVALIAFTIGLLVINYSKFKGSSRIKGDLFVGGRLGDGVVTYAIALVVAAAMLWVTGAFDSFGYMMALYQTVYLSVATVLGASAGRLLL